MCQYGFALLELQGKIFSSGRSLLFTACVTERFGVSPEKSKIYSTHVLGAIKYVSFYEETVCVYCLRSRSNVLLL